MKRVSKCQKCKREFRGYPALSRVDNKTWICPRCGVKEALDATNLSEKEKEEILNLLPILEDR